MTLFSQHIITSRHNFQKITWYKYYILHVNSVAWRQLKTDEKVASNSFIDSAWEDKIRNATKVIIQWNTALKTPIKSEGREKCAKIHSRRPSKKNKIGLLIKKNTFEIEWIETGKQSYEFSKPLKFGIEKKYFKMKNDKLNGEK